MECDSHAARFIPGQALGWATPAPCIWISIYSGQPPPSCPALPTLPQPTLSTHRNNHFNVLHKHGGQLYLLITDQAGAECMRWLACV